MRRLLKQLLGLVAILVGVALLGAALGQKWLRPEEPFAWGPLLGGLLWGSVSIYYGRRWLFDLISLDVLPVEPGDPEVEAAKARAQASLERLWESLAENRYECFVKIPMQVEAGGVEHIWAVLHAREGDGVVVSLANDPVDTPKDPSQRRVVPIRDLEDWQVMVSEDEIRGGYSIGALARIARSRGHRISGADRRRLEAFVDLDLDAPSVGRGSR